MFQESKRRKLIKNLAIIFLSVLVAVIIVRKGLVQDFLVLSADWGFVGSFVAGIFFISIFTVAPAGVMLFEIAKTAPVWEVALFGGLGAVVGDFLIFRFIKNNFAEDIVDFFRRGKIEIIVRIFHLSSFRWLLPVIGAIIIASPLPDELGLALMGLSKVKTWKFILISFALNTMGILLLAVLAKT